MIEYISDTTVRLVPSSGRKPRKRLTVLETQIRNAIKSAITSQVRKTMWLQKQLRRVAQYEAALERRGYSKSDGLPGWWCPASRKVMLRR